MADDSTRLLAIFSLNGKRMTVECVWQAPKVEQPRALVVLREKIAAAIAAEVLDAALKNLRFTNWRS